MAHSAIVISLMQALNNPSLTKQLQQFLQHQKNALTWVETHGLLCAIAVGPEPIADWQQLIYLDNRDVDVSSDTAAVIDTTLAQLSERISSDIMAGNGLTLPCRLDPYEDNDGSDLAAWCAGFLTGVLSQESVWHQDNEAAAANLLLPIVLISGLDEDDMLDQLWDNTALVRKMALGMTDLLEEIFLHFHAPDLPSE